MDMGIRVILILILIFLAVKRADLYALYAKKLYSSGKIDKAIVAFKRANIIGKLNANNKVLLGYLLLREGQLDEARQVLVSASMNPLEKDAVKQRIKSMRALIAWKDGDIESAIEFLEDVLKSYKSTSVYQNLGLMYILKQDKAKALSFCLEGYEYNSDDNIILDNLAEAYALNGQDDKAAEIYEKLMTKEPSFPEAYYGFGLLKIKLGDKDRGLELIKKSLDKKYTYLSVLQKEDVEKMYIENGGTL